MKRTRTLSMLLAAILACSASACSDTSAPTNDTEAPSGALTDAGTEAEEGYPYGGADLGGYEFKVFNLDEIWNFYVSLDFEQSTGEKLDDAIYARNLKVEEALNFKLVEEKYPFANGIANMIPVLTKSIMAGDYAYDAAYVPLSQNPALVTDDYLLDMTTISTMHLDEDWWDQQINDALTINGKVYCASSPLHLMTFDGAWAFLFNYDIFDDYKQEYPYQLVRDGKWTLDEYNRYINVFTNLNGADNFNFVENGQAMYGCAGHRHAAVAMTLSAGNYLVKMQDDGSYDIGIDTERMVNTIDKLCESFNSELGQVLFNADASAPSGYVTLFKNNRAAFMTAELKSTMEQRDMQSTFGIVPFPKLDETQKDYRTFTTYTACLLTIPKVQKDAERTGLILDALSYESMKSVLPVYYDVTVSQKGLRNEESIEMLEIIRDSRTTEFSQILGITSYYFSTLCAMIETGTNTTASVAASQKSAIEGNLQKLLNYFYE